LSLCQILREAFGTIPRLASARSVLLSSVDVDPTVVKHHKRWYRCRALREFVAGVLGHRTDGIAHKHEGGFALVELHLGTISQLFNSLDPSPFFEADLDKDATEFLVSSVQEIPSREPVKVRVYCDKVPHSKHSALAADAVRNFFKYRARLARLSLRKRFSIARWSMFIAFVVLFVVVLFQTLIDEAWTDENSENTSRAVLWNTVHEGINVVAWVALWAPINMFLYDWIPTRREHATLQRLADAEVEIHEVITNAASPAVAAASQ
jgi:hypothetical protein